jgi:C4-dicarboxylate-specific signal transduction histidine kinase
LKQVTNLNADLVWSFDPGTYQIQWVNSACHSRLGMEAGQDCRTYLHPDLEFIETIIPTARQGQQWEGVLNFHEPFQNQLVPLFSKVVQVEFQNTPLLVCTAMDLEKKERLESSVIQQAKLASVGQMTCDVALEIINPLSIIIGRTEELLRKVHHHLLTPEILDRELNKILQTGHRIVRVTRSLRSFSRNSDKDPKTQVFLSKVLDEAIELCLDRLHQNGIQLRRQIEPHLFVSVRTSEIEQVLINLILNSIDAIKNSKEKWIEIRADQIERTARIHITDSGCGIPAEIANDIMKPFFTTKERGLGTGLGLTISQSLILDHGGRLFLNQDSENTCFTIELPALQAKLK